MGVQRKALLVPLGWLRRCGVSEPRGTDPHRVSSVELVWWVSVAGSVEALSLSPDGTSPCSCCTSRDGSVSRVQRTPRLSYSGVSQSESLGAPAA